MARNIDNTIFGKLTVIKEVFSLAQPSGQIKRRHLCICECGKEVIRNTRHLNHKSNCGDGSCLPYSSNKVNQRFGRLTVQKLVIKNENRHWECLCDCGNIHQVYGGDLVTGKIVSCGCFRKEQALKATKGKPGKKTLPSGLANFNRLFKNYMRNAKKAGRVWALSEEEFRTITQRNCYYCDASPKSENNHGRKYSGNGTYVYNGVDRKENGIGYVLSNCLPCCTPCNFSKRDSDYNEYLERLVKTVKNLKLL